jgi:hypothetical protein
MAPSRTSTDTDGFDHTSLTCKAFAALLCVSSVAVGCVTLVSALKTQDPISVYRPDAVRRELPRDGPFMAVDTANPHGLHGPGAVSPTKEEFQAHLGEFAKKKGAGWLFGRNHRGKGRGGRGKGKGEGRGSLPFGHAGMRGPTGDFLWDRGAGRRGHHVESGIGPMQVRAADYDEEEAMGKVRGCLLNLARSGAPMVPGERGFYPSPAKWASYHEGNVEAVQTATRRSPQPRQLFLGDSITRGPGSKARPGWPASAAQAAGWPRLAEAQGQPAAWPGAARALRKEPAGQSLSRLVSEIGAVSRRTEVPGARQVVRPRCSRLVSAVTRRPTFCGAFGTSAWSKCPRSQRPVRPSTAPEAHPLAWGGPLGRARERKGALAAWMREGGRFNAVRSRGFRRY